MKKMWLVLHLNILLDRAPKLIAEFVPEEVPLEGQWLFAIFDGSSPFL